MLKCRLFTFSKYNLDADIEEFKDYVNDNIKLSGNEYTLKLMFENFMLNGYPCCELNTNKNTNNNLYGKYMGYNVYINNNLDDGTISIDESNV